MYFSLISCLFALEVEIVPTIGYTNYFCKKVYSGIGEQDLVLHKNIDLSALSIGLDIIMIGTSHVTFFFNNHVSFLEKSREHGDVDIVKGRGSSVVEDVLYDVSCNVGYTFFLDNFRLGLGAGLGIFAGSEGLEEKSPLAAGLVMNMNVDYFLINSLALSLGIDDGVYGSIKEKRKDEMLKVYNRLGLRIGCVIKF